MFRFAILFSQEFDSVSTQRQKRGVFAFSV